MEDHAAPGDDHLDGPKAVTLALEIQLQLTVAFGLAVLVVVKTVGLANRSRTSPPRDLPRALPYEYYVKSVGTLVVTNPSYSMRC